MKYPTRTQGPFPSELAKGEIAAVRPSPEAIVVAASDSADEEQVRAGAPAADTGAEAEATAAGRHAAPIEMTGIVFVHGIGSQLPGETLLQWSAPLIDGVTAWRRWAAPPVDGPVDPVSTATIDFTTGLPLIKVDVPEYENDHGEHPPMRWLITENWWAAKVAPPSLATMASWLGPQGGVGQIVDAILGNRGPSSPLLWLAQAAVVPFVSVLAGLVLTVYSLFRSLVGFVPIEAVRNAAFLRMFDEFLTGWFGDARILLYDPAQSANIRAGLASAIERLRGQGCSSVVVVAHSGGAMVSYLTLTDPALAPTAQVNKLITFGEAWNLGLILTPKGAGMADRLRRDITEAQPSLRWRDFWASHDPAPAGVLNWREIRPPLPIRPRAFRSKRVWNRRSLLDDHGTYFENDEEFTIPLLRELDVPNGWGEESRFFRPSPLEAQAVLDTLASEDAAEAAAERAAAERAAADGAAAGDTGPVAIPQRGRYAVALTQQPLQAYRPPRDSPEARLSPRVARRRERIAVLALWRHLSLSVPVAVIAVVLSFPDRLEQLGLLVAERLPRVPLVADAIDWLRPLGAIRVDPPVLPEVDLYPLAALIGLATLQAIVLIAILQLVAAPVAAFHAYPENSRQRNAVFAVEVILAIALLASLLPLFAAPDHGRFLGAGLVAWLPGIAATGLILAFVWGGSEIVRRSGAAALNRLFGVLATVAFIVALASTLITIFERDGLEMAELGYVAIWAAFLVLYKIGLNRWSQWDRVEREAAYHDDSHRRPSRTPALISSIGFLVALAAVVAYVFAWERQIFEVLVAAAVGLIGFAMVIGGIAWSRHSDPIAAPPPVGSARGF